MQALRLGISAQCNPIFTCLKAACIHSTTACQAKWKAKWVSDAHGSRNSSKDYAKYIKRQKRAEAKRTLRELHSMSMHPKILFQEGAPIWNARKKKKGKMLPNEKIQQNCTMNARSKRRTRHKASTIHSSRVAESIKDYRRRKRKNKGAKFKHCVSDEEETVFKASFGGRCFYWSFSDWSELQWQTSGWEFHCRGRKRYSDNYFHNGENHTIGSASDRSALGLSPTGPLKLEDVKQAFRMCALKWHPDRNQGSSKSLHLSSSHGVGGYIDIAVFIWGSYGQ